MKKALVSAAVGLAILGGGYMLTTSSDKPARQAGPPRDIAVPVAVATVVQGNLPIELRAVGTVEAESSIVIRSRVDGEIVQTHFREGDVVKAGQPLFTIDDRSARAAVAQAEAALARSKASLAGAKRELDRYTQLAEKGAATRQKLDEATTQQQLAEAAVKVDDAALATARLQLSYTRIAAPIDGRAGAVTLPRGNMARSADAASLVVLNQIRPIKVSFALPQIDLPAVRERFSEAALPVEVAIPGDKAGAVTGQLAFIDNKVDVTTGTITVKASFANEDDRLWPGQLVNVTLRLKDDPNAIQVPAPAVQSGQNGTYVYVVKPDGRVDARPVVIARSVGEIIVVSSGLATGDIVVVDGQFRLAPGSKVDIKKKDEPPKGPEAAQ
jgi:multidrug efflux system membrane fusion protein